MIEFKDNLLAAFKNDPEVQKLTNSGNMKKVAQLATAMGTAGGSPELRKYGKELWERSQRQL